MNRILLLSLGFIQFQTENFAYFKKRQNKLLLRSGFIGMGNHINIIDYLYYSYIFNPVFVKIIILTDIVQEKEIIKDITYAPLNYVEAFQCALENSGFEPIIVKSQKEFKKIKHRKMTMKTLVSECFEQMKGGIFILLPGTNINEHIQIQQKIALDIYQNEQKFLRSGVGFKITFEDRDIYSRKFKNQIYFILHLMSELRLNRLNIKALTFRNYKNVYKKQTYRNFIDESLYQQQGKSIRKISYIQYVEEQNRLVEDERVIDKKSL